MVSKSASANNGCVLNILMVTSSPGMPNGTTTTCFSFDASICGTNARESPLEVKHKTVTFSTCR